jgi:hypothetical protein
MSCLIGHIAPVQNLLRELGVTPECTSWRQFCRRGLEKRQRSELLGAYGAALGYCQGLVPRDSSPATHTRALAKLLSDIGAPCARSHELFWGHVAGRPVGEFVDDATLPLRGSGRVPVFITPLDVERDGATIEALFETALSADCDRPILVRLVLGSDSSIVPAAAMMRRLLDRARAARQLPQWWPLFQANIKYHAAAELKRHAGDDWRYYCFAVNPFVAPETLSFLGTQVVVAQVPVGLASGISADGAIQLPHGMAISGATSSKCSYSLPAFAGCIAALGVRPTVIIVGPSAQDWNLDIARERLQRLMALMPATLSTMWRLSSDTITEVLCHAA